MSSVSSKGVVHGGASVACYVKKKSLGRRTQQKVNPSNPNESPYRAPKGRGREEEEGKQAAESVIKMRDSNDISQKDITENELSVIQTGVKADDEPSTCIKLKKEGPRTGFSVQDVDNEGPVQKDDEHGDENECVSENESELLSPQPHGSQKLMQEYLIMEKQGFFNSSGGRGSSQKQLMPIEEKSEDEAQAARDSSFEDDLICSGSGDVQKRQNLKNFNYILKEKNNNQQPLLLGNTEEEEQFLFDSLNSLKGGEQQSRTIENSLMNSQMQMILQQAITNFSIEKKMKQEVRDVKGENEGLREQLEQARSDADCRNQELQELRIRVKEMEIQNEHLNSLLQKERCEKESNALTFKRILQSLTFNKENCPDSHFSSRKFSQQFDQPSFKHSLNVQKSLDYESSLPGQSTQEQICHLKRQLQSKEEELTSLKRANRRGANQSVWWGHQFPNKKAYFNQSSQACSPLPTQPSLPSNQAELLLSGNGGISTIKKGHQTSVVIGPGSKQGHNLFSPIQGGSPIMSHQGSLQNWINSQQANHLAPHPSDNMRPSYTEEVVMHENSFDQEAPYYYRDLYEVPIQEESSATEYLSGKNLSSLQAKRPQMQDDLRVLGEEANEVKLSEEEKNLEMMISGGDYSPNSHTFFKHPFKNNQNVLNGSQNDQANAEYYGPNHKRSHQKIVQLQGCQKHEGKRQANSNQHSYKKPSDMLKSSGKGGNYSSMIQMHKPTKSIVPSVSPLALASKGIPIKGSLNHSPSNPQRKSYQHISTKFLPQKENNFTCTNRTQATGPTSNNPNNNSLLGPQNTLGTTFTTLTTGTNTSTVSPHNKKYRVIPDSLVKHSKFKAPGKENDNLQAKPKAFA